MSIHPSLKSPAQNKEYRSVLKRTERLKMLLEKGLWQKGNFVFGLPKIKVFRIKIKKEKAEKAAGTAEAGAAPAEGTTPPTATPPPKPTPKPKA